MKTKRLKGFTLFELSVVLIIISILAGIGFISYTGSKTRANYVKVRGDMQEIISAATMFKVDHKRYPADGAGSLGVELSGYLANTLISPCKSYSYAWENLPASGEKYVGASYREPNTAGYDPAYVIFYYELKNDSTYSYLNDIKNYGSQDIKTLAGGKVTCSEKLSP